MFSPKQKFYEWKFTETAATTPKNQMGPLDFTDS